MNIPKPPLWVFIAIVIAALIVMTHNAARGNPMFCWGLCRRTGDDAWTCRVVCTEDYLDVREAIIPIVRTYGCNECGRFMEVTLTMEQVDNPPPDCPWCAVRTQQEFKPIAIGGSTVGKAVKLAETIAAEDYGVADMQHDTRQGGTPKVRFKDQGTAMQQAQMSTWGVSGNTIETAISLGRQARMANGGSSGVETLQRMLKDGSQPDLIENSKRRAMRVW